MAHIQALAAPRRVWDLGAPVSAVALNGDGSRVLAAAQDVRLLDAGSGTLIAKLNETVDRWNPEPVAFNADGSRAFIVAGGNRTLLVDGRTGAHVADVEGGYQAAFSPDGWSLATAFGEHSGLDVRIWDARNGVQVGSPIRHKTKHVWSGKESVLEFSKDGKSLLTSGESVRIWRLPTGAPEGAVEAGGDLRWPNDAIHGHFSPDGSIVLAVNYSRAQLYRRADRKALGALMTHDAKVIGAAFTHDGRALVSAAEDGLVRLWSADMAQPARIGEQFGATLPHGAPIGSFALSRDGRLAATGGEDGVARLWSLDPWGPFGKKMVHASPVLALAFSGDGRSLATASRDGTVRLWDVPTAPTDNTYLPLRSSEVRVSPDASRLFAADFVSGASLLLALPGGAPIATLPDAESGVKNRTFDAYVFDKDSRRLLTVIASGPYVAPREAWVWDAATGKRLAGPLRGQFLTADLGPGGKRFVTHGRDEGLMLWDVDSGSRVAAVQLPVWVYSAVFSPDGRRIALSMLDRTQIREAASIERVELEVPHGAGAAAWSPDGTLLLTTNDYRETARLWDARTGAAICGPIVHDGFASRARFSPDGRLLLTASEGKGYLVDTTSGRMVGAPLANGAKIGAAAFSPDGTAAATVGADGIIRFWDTRAGEPLGRPLWQGNTGEMTFSRDGRTLYAVGTPYLFHGWDVSWLDDHRSAKRISADAEALSQRRTSESDRVETVPLGEWNTGGRLP